MRKPFFSIITCTYNSEKYILECIKSVEKQTFIDYEHIFIDGFSKDKTLEIIKKYKKKNPKKVRIYQLNPKGISNAMNEGIKHAKGNFLCFLHSDDYFYTPKTLEIVHNSCKEKDHNLIIGRTAKKYEKNNKIVVFKKISNIKEHSLFIENYVSHQNTFIKKELFDKYGSFDERLKYCMDYEYILRLLKNKENPDYVNEAFSVFRVHENSMSASHKHILEILKEDYYARKKNTPHYLIYEVLSLINKLVRQAGRWIGIK